MFALGMALGITLMLIVATAVIVYLLITQNRALTDEQEHREKMVGLKDEVIEALHSQIATHEKRDTRQQAQINRYLEVS